MDQKQLMKFLPADLFDLSGFKIRIRLRFRHYRKIVDNKKKLVIWRLARVVCALTEHNWQYMPSPKFNSSEWREQFPRGLVECQCRRCKETKFDRRPGYRGK